MSEKADDLKKVTSDTVKMLFGDTPQEDDPTGGAYALWKEFVPDLAPHISMFFAGRLYSRDVLTQKQRELCAVASLTVLDKPTELKAHIHAALNVGATREEVAEVIVQQCTYGGVPIMVEGLRSLKEVLSSRTDSP